MLPLLLLLPAAGRCLSTCRQSPCSSPRPAPSAKQQAGSSGSAKALALAAHVMCLPAPPTPCPCPTHLLHKLGALAAHVQPRRPLLQRLGQLQVQCRLDCNDSRASSLCRGKFLRHLRQVRQDSAAQGRGGCRLSSKAVVQAANGSRSRRHNSRSSVPVPPMPTCCVTCS